MLHAVADHVVDHYLEVTDNLAADIEAVEEQVFAPRHATRIEPLYLVKREILEFRRAVTPLGAALRRIIDEHHDLFSKEVRRRLRDVSHHHFRVASRSPATTTL